MKKLLLVILPTFVVVTGCHEFGGGVRGGSPQYHPGTLPPAHAPAHGRRAQQYRYYYYPEAQFYFDIGRNLYFYLDSRGTGCERGDQVARFDDQKQKRAGKQQKNKHNKKYKKKKYDDDDDAYKRRGRMPYDY